jgi:hypothetical protein
MFNPSNKVAIGDMIVYEGTTVERPPKQFVAHGIITKTHLHGYPNIAEVEWINGLTVRGSIDIRNCKVIGQ